MMTSSVALLELNLEQVADLAMGTLQLIRQRQEIREPNLGAELGRLTT
jgi:hypothetical protein